MNKAKTSDLIKGLRATAQQIEDNPALFCWSSPMDDQCGWLVRTLLGWTEEQLVDAHVNRYSWNAMVNRLENFRTHRLKYEMAFEPLLTSLEQYGLTLTDISQLENLTNPLVMDAIESIGLPVKWMEAKRPTLNQTDVGTVVSYLRAWVWQLESNLVPQPIE